MSGLKRRFECSARRSVRSSDSESETSVTRDGRRGAMAVVAVPRVFHRPVEVCEVEAPGSTDWAEADFEGRGAPTAWAGRPTALDPNHIQVRDRTARPN